MESLLQDNSVSEVPYIASQHKLWAREQVICIWSLVVSCVHDLIESILFIFIFNEGNSILFITFHL